MKIIDILLNPVTCMLLGTTYYIVIPSIFFFNNYFGLSFIQGVVSQYVDYQSRDVYLLNIYDFVIINLSFIFGVVFSSFLKVNANEHDSSVVSSFKLTPRTIFLLLMFFLIFVLIKARLTGYQFFSGYSTYEISVLGPLATLCFMSMWFYIYYHRSYFLLLFITVGIFLLGSGSRMFFLLPLMSLIINSVFNSPQKILKYFIVFIFSVSSMLLVGILREGNSISVDGLLTILFAEPIFTSLGTLFYFNESRHAIGFPVDILAAFVNFIPSFIYPDKVILLNSLTFSDDINNPLGAQSLLINLYKNFGWFYPFFMIVLGFYFGILYKYKSNKLVYTIYVMSLPLVLLHFQREGFITVFKVLFFNGLIFPVVLLFFFRLLYKRKRSE
ncbi:oligosaccharide repeat unit polymerase [Shewanella baltica]|uniref:O-antigen polymerase n=1 Tax=Shewanella baltica TaxID=62322 RepID=UPI00217EECC1|nr:O-antigen polymerase [Shewanella baltica]MCS6136734.1 oligosaccharide repeat unit polymerase [Shewanella baltica]